MLEKRLSLWTIGFMATGEEVSVFLKEFKLKMKIWDVLFRDDRGKNSRALAELELRPIDRKKILETLETEDYSEGPIEEKLYGGSDMWVFGKSIKKKGSIYKDLHGYKWGKCYLYFLSYSRT